MPRTIKSVTIGQQIRKAREEAGITQTELAVKIGWKQPNISELETSKIMPTVDALCRLADALKATWGYDGRRLIFQRR
jgi:transcriptional regulator with XRE-family HTH domain